MSLISNLHFTDFLVKN